MSIKLNSQGDFAGRCQVCIIWYLLFHKFSVILCEFFYISLFQLTFCCCFLCWLPLFLGKPFLPLLHVHQLIMKKHAHLIIAFFNQRRGCIGGINGFRSFKNLDWFLKNIFQVTKHTKLYLQPGTYTSNSMLFLDGIRILMQPWKLMKKQ